MEKQIVDDGLFVVCKTKRGSVVWFAENSKILEIKQHLREIKYRFEREKNSSSEYFCKHQKEFEASEGRIIKLKKEYELLKEYLIFLTAQQ